MSCGTCPDSAQPTTRQDGTAPTPGTLLWSADVGAWYRRQRAQDQRPAISLPAMAASPSLPPDGSAPSPVWTSPKEAYDYALQHGPSDDTRAAACQDVQRAYWYAREVDHGPRDDTRAAACQSPVWARYYAVLVDQGPRDDTRAAACGSSLESFYYARDIDCGPRDDTRAGACQDAQHAFWYARDIDHGPHPDTWAACKKSRSQAWGRPAYERLFGRPS